MNIVNGKLSYVIFDGTSYYVGDENDMKMAVASGECEVVFKAFCLDKCAEKADELNELL